LKNLFPSNIFYGYAPGPGVIFLSQEGPGIFLKSMYFSPKFSGGALIINADLPHPFNLPMPNIQANMTSQ